MAELIDLNINIGANTTDFQSSLQRAENLLKQFESALKRATNVGEINYLNTQIKNLNGTISGIKTQMQGVSRPTTDATNALSNLSRVAQDAPYGFIGIANNLNPLLESFQRLKTQTGSSTEALKSMAAGLVGPAGIGLALGVVSSLAVTYSDEISAFFNGPTEKLKKFREELNKLNQDVFKIVGEAQSNRTVALNLVNIISGGTSTQQEEALKKLKSLYSQNKEIKDATIKTDKAWLIHLVNVAAIQEDAAGKEKNTQEILSATYTERSKLLAAQRDEIGKLKPIITQSGGIGDFGGKVISVESQKDAIVKRYKPLLDALDLTIKNAKDKNLELLNTLTNIETPDKNAPKEKKDKTLPFKDAQNLIRQINRTNAILTPLEEAPKDTFLEDSKKQHEDYLKWLTGWTKWKEKLAQKNIDQESDDVKKLTKEYENFSMTISSSVTSSLFGMYDAMQQGVSAGEALGQMFGRLAEQIAQTLIQATLFAAIMSLLPGGSVAAGGKGFLGFFKDILGLASGGVATGPTLAMIGEGAESEAVLPLSKLSGMLNTTFNAGAMSSNSMGQNGQFVLKGNDLVLALQRSNTSLNLRRGI